MHLILVYVLMSIMTGVIPILFISHLLLGIISLFIPRDWYYRGEDGIWGWYQEVVLFCFEHIASFKFKIHGNIPKIKENVIMLCNHQSSMDWIVADSVAIRQNMVGHMRFVFKDILKYFPLFGYIWGVHGGVFVKRDGTYNMQHMKEKLKQLIGRKVPICLVIFPEGTRYDKTMQKSLKRSQAFAEKKNMKPLSHVLTPRVKAMHYSIESLRSDLNAINDITILYETWDGRVFLQAPAMTEVLAGKCKNIHLIFNRIPIEEIPNFQTEDETFSWLYELWKTKDDQLDMFLQSDSSKFNNTFPMRDLQPVSIFKTGLSFFTSFSLTAMLFTCYYGKLFYFGTVFIGTIYCWVYATLFF